MSGKHSRTKGRSFEQLIATAYRERWPDAVVRRSLQAHQPYEPDVVVDLPARPWVNALWTECQHADAPAPLVKLAQAERDVGRWAQHANADAANRLPVVVWRKSGAAQINATLRLAVLLNLSQHPWPYRADSNDGRGQLVVTLAFTDLLAAISDT